MPISESDIKFKLSVVSGSAGNSTAQGDPNDSLGKYISTTEVSGTALNNLFDDVSGDDNTLGTVDYRCVFIHNAHATLTWQSPKVWLGGLRATAAASTDRIEITAHPFSNNQRVRVEADYTGDALPDGVTAGTTYYVIDSDTNSFQLSETQSGAAVDITTDGGSFSVRQYANSAFAVGIDPEVASDIGASAAQAAIIVDESTAPSGVSFSSPLTKATGVSLGNLAPGKCRAVWIRRIPLNAGPRNNDGLTLATSGDTAE